MPGITDVHARATEIYEQLRDRSLYDRAKEAGVTFSRFLELEDPSDPEERRSGNDAFTRIMRVAQIVTQSDRYGTYYADPMERFNESENNRQLFPEWASRTWKRAQAQYFSNDAVLGTVARPYTDDATPRASLIRPAIPLDEVVSQTTPIDQPVYRSWYLDDPTASQARMVRIGEAAELPRVKLTGSQHAINLHKFGRALEASYESLRRMRIDTLAFHIRRMSVQAEVDKVVAAMDVMINGDGNANTAATSYNLTTIDPAAVAGTLTAKGYLAFLLKFLQPYAATTILVQEAVALQLELLTLGTANIPMAVINAGLGVNRPFVPINQQVGNGVRLGITADAPTLKIVAFDNRFAVERVTEVGSDIQEAERWIHRQVEIMTFSENEAYAIIDQRATRVLNINA